MYQATSTFDKHKYSQATNQFNKKSSVPGITNLNSYGFIPMPMPMHERPQSRNLNNIFYTDDLNPTSHTASVQGRTESHKDIINTSYTQKDFINMSYTTHMDIINKSTDPVNQIDEKIDDIEIIDLTADPKI